VCVYTHAHIYTHIHSTYAHSESPRKKRALFVSLSSLSLFSSLCVLCVVHRYEEVHIFKVFALKLFVHWRERNDDEHLFFFFFFDDDDDDDIKRFCVWAAERREEKTDAKSTRQVFFETAFEERERERKDKEKDGRMTNCFWKSLWKEEEEEEEEEEIRCRTSSK